MNYNKTEMRFICRQACKAWFGFGPSMKDVVLLEASGDARYIRFKVNDIEYVFTTTRVIFDYDRREVDLGEYEIRGIV